MSESQFKTLKYQPDYPRRFENYAHALQWCEDYVAWYNHEHHHSNLAGYTPEQVFTGEYKALAKVRQAALDSAFREYPELMLTVIFIQNLFVGSQGVNL